MQEEHNKYIKLDEDPKWESELSWKLELKELKKIGKIKKTGEIIYQRQRCGCIVIPTKRGNFDRIFYCNGLKSFDTWKKYCITDEDDIKWYDDYLFKHDKRINKYNIHNYSRKVKLN